MSAFIAALCACVLAVFAQDQPLAAVAPVLIVLAAVLVRLPDAHHLAPLAEEGR